MISWPSSVTRRAPRQSESFLWRLRKISRPEPKRRVVDLPEYSKIEAAIARNRFKKPEAVLEFLQIDNRDPLKLTAPCQFWIVSRRHVVSVEMRKTSGEFAHINQSSGKFPIVTGIQNFDRHSDDGLSAAFACRTKTQEIFLRFYV